jgi:hypothetical protein
VSGVPKVPKVTGVWGAWVLETGGGVFTELLKRKLK